MSALIDSIIDFGVFKIAAFCLVSIAVVLMYAFIIFRFSIYRKLPKQSFGRALGVVFAALATSIAILVIIRVAIPINTLNSVFSYIVLVFFTIFNLLIQFFILLFYIKIIYGLDFKQSLSFSVWVFLFLLIFDLVFSGIVLPFLLIGYSKIENYYYVNQIKNQIENNQITNCQGYINKNLGPFADARCYFYMAEVKKDRNYCNFLKNDTSLYSRDKCYENVDKY